MLSIEDIWSNMWYGLRASGSPLVPYQNLVNAYSVPTRTYHSFEGHVASMAQELDSSSKHFSDVELIQFSVFYHDAVYIPGNAENEYLSGQLAKQAAKTARLPQVFGETVEAMIMSTKYHQPTTYHEQILVDLDLVILGKSEEEFDQYEMDIRTEHFFVPFDVFTVKRAKILRAFLDRKRIYNLEHFAEQYEVAARKNLERSLQKLGG